MEPLSETTEVEIPEVDLDEETEQVSSPESPPQDKEEFNRRVEKLMEMMNDDPAVRDRILAEMYVNIASAEQGIRGVFETLQREGMSGFMRGAFSRRKD